MIFPFWRLDELLCSSLNPPQHTVYIDLENLLDVRRLNICNRLYLREAGIVDDDVEAAELLLRMVDGCVYVRSDR
jgi:hypothetical protein